jgi:DNA-directed RNA polymerase specialized sigma24 family protein
MKDDTHEALFGRILGWLRRRIRHRGLDHLEDDLVGAAGLAFTRALQAWRCDRGPLRPFAWRYVKRETLELIARETMHTSRSVSCDEVDVEEPRADPRIPSLDLLDPHDADHRLLWLHVVEGQSIREIARTHAVSLRQAREGLNRAIERLQEVAA